MIMNVYNGFEYMRDVLSGANNREISRNWRNDVDALMEICRSCEWGVAHNGVRYLYFYPIHDNGVAHVADVLKRNGFLPRIHTSYRGVFPESVVRIPENAAWAQPGKMAFTMEIYQKLQKRGWHDIATASVNQKTR